MKDQIDGGRSRKQKFPNNSLAWSAWQVGAFWVKITFGWALSLAITPIDLPVFDIAAFALNINPQPVWGLQILFGSFTLCNFLDFDGN